MKALIFCPSTNAPGKSDVTGAFRPEARNFQRHHDLGGSIVTFDNTRPLPERRRVVDAAIDGAVGGQISCVAWFCHGWKNGLQTGHVLANVAALGARLAACLAPDAAIVLYACDTARDSDGLREDDKLTGPGGSGGFASRLFVDLHGRGLTGVRVYAHSTAGHTTRNPYLRVWRDDADLHNGDWLIEPGSDLWRAWVRGLRDTALRFEFPWLSASEICARLGG